MNYSTGQTRRRRAAHKFAAWLAAGTITAGLGVAMVGGTAVAYADTGSAGSPSHSASDTSNSSSSKRDSTGSSRRAVGKPSPKVKATGGAVISPSAQGLATPTDSKPSLSLVTTDATAKASATPKIPTVQSVLSDIARQIDYTFFNKAPTASPTQDAQAGVNKQVDGAVNGSSNNGFDPTYTVTEKPKYGTVTLDPRTGQYTYVARDELITPGITDQFTVSVSNGAAAKLPGLLGQLQFVLHSMAVALGVAKPDTIEKDIVVKISGTGKYGTPADQAQYWLEQTIDNDCVLIADAAIIAQLGGPKFTEDEIVAIGKSTPSVVDPTKPIYVGTKADTGSGGVYTNDGVALLKKYGIDATYTSYVDDPEPGEAPNKATQVDGQRALADVEAALAAGKAVAVVVDAGLIVNASGQNVETPAPEANHWVVVTGVDISTGKIYLNDGNLTGGSAPVSVAGFMWSWQSSDFGVIVASKAPAPAAAIAA
ncbi:hypothetical protein [Mycolicibacterium rhodesiae]|uniref:Peptidase C39-like domain-containing protein n=1 Tax=Mycolicibacterium rhodesiae TaxID=36814 RepID=A0A1X0J5U4_MYCRH|nr:hypothetical protein [Mycolicibacterium rhodesiae]MCV7345744.1 hypothetical protein [Mycolicibacterium rhodesiae]ORB57116.1 hypothetical protein BST42_01520 [Mycolicibacterium rhodesiae]